MRTALRLLITLVVVAAAIAAGFWLWHYYLYSPWTRDARVGADIITIAPDVSGRVVALPVTDNQRVEAGDTLFRIDDARYAAALNKASAVVAQREAELALRQDEASRRSRLSRQAISAENVGHDQQPGRVGLPRPGQKRCGQRPPGPGAHRGQRAGLGARPQPAARRRQLRQSGSRRHGPGAR